MKRILALLLLLIIVLSAFPTGSNAVGNENADSNDGSPRFTYAYGVWGVMLLLPSPFIEGGVRFGAVELRGNFSYILAYLDARAEFAVCGLNKAKTLDIFVNYGRIGVIQTGYGYCYGAGIDIKPQGRAWFFRTELGAFEPDNEDIQILPRIGLGWRL